MNPSKKQEVRERSQYSDLKPAQTQKITTKEDKYTKSESEAKEKSLTDIGQSVTVKISKENSLLKPTESSFQQQINRLKSENQHLYNAKIPEGFTSRLKRQKEGKQFQQTNSNLGMSLQQTSKQFDQYESNSLNNDLSAPILTKNFDEFNINQLSGKTIPNPRKSEKSVTFLDSPQKSSSRSIKESNESNYDNFYSIRNQESSKLIESISQMKIQQEIIALKSEISSLKAQNDKLSSQLQSKNKEITYLTSQSQEYLKSMLDQRQQINSKDNQLQRISQENIHLLQQQTKIIQQKDRKIQSLISSTLEAQRQFGLKESQFQKSIQELQTRLKQFEQLSLQNERNQELIKEISKLKQNLQNVNTEKRELNNRLIEAQSKSNAYIMKVKQLEKKISKYLEKQILLKEQVIMLQQQSNKITEILSEKQQDQQKLGQKIIILNQQNGSLKEKIKQLQNQCELLNQRNQGLKDEIDLLQIYQPSNDSYNEIAELNKKLIEKNRKLLHQIEEKNLLMAEMEKEEGQLKRKEVVQVLSTSRLQKQKYQEIVDKNQKLQQSQERQSQYIKQIQKLQGNQNLFKERLSQLQKDKSQLNSEIYRLTAQILTLKQKRTEKSQQGTSINKLKENASPLKPAVDLSDIVGQINSILIRRKQQEQLQNALRLFIGNNTRQQQQFERWSRQRGLIQEKAKLASKELHKIKSNIMKTAGKSIAQKTQLTNLLKPAEAIVNELINISEHLIELDPYEEQEESIDNPNQKS